MRNIDGVIIFFRYKQIGGEDAAVVGAWGGGDGDGGGGGGAAEFLSTFGSKQANPHDRELPRQSPDRTNSPDIEALMDGACNNSAPPPQFFFFFLIFFLFSGPLEDAPYFIQFVLTCAYIDDVITFLGFSIDFDDDDDDDTDLFSESKKKNPVAAAAAVAAPPPATLPSFSAVPPPAAVRERHASQLTPAADGGSWEASDVTRNLVLWCFDALHGLEARKRGHCTYCGGFL